MAAAVGSTKRKPSGIEEQDNVEARDRKKSREDERPSPADGQQGEEIWRFNATATVSEDKGARNEMEDVWVSQSGEGCCFFAIFDGHGGKTSAQFAAQNLHREVVGAGLLEDKGTEKDDNSIKRALKLCVIQGFKTTDVALLKHNKEKRIQDGAAAVAVWLVRGRWVVVANVGDAKCVLARAAQEGQSDLQLKALTITKDHLAIYPGERARIEKAGGIVTADGRLNGRMQVSRSFGDIQFKNAGASAVPDVQVFKISLRDSFMICGCDGFWGVFDSHGAVELIYRLLNEGREHKAVTNKLLYEAVRVRGCKDNCTVMLIHFQHTRQNLANMSELGGTSQSAGIS